MFSAASGCVLVLLEGLDLPAVPEVPCNDLFPQVMHVEEPLEQLHWLLEARGAGTRAGAGVDGVHVNACTETS